MDGIIVLAGVLFCMLYFVQDSSCHLCLISPPQRGSMNGLNKPGSDDCFLIKPPCGGRTDDQAKTVILREGQNFTVTFQKNLNHWTAATPGDFRIMIGKEKFEKLEKLALVQDMNEPDLHLYSVNVTIPVLSLKVPLILQVVYVTKNPKAPVAFYQCSDVIVTDRF